MLLSLKSDTKEILYFSVLVLQVMSRIQDLVSSLKGSYKDMTVENTRRILNSIQFSIQRKDEEMVWVDSCCLQLVVKNKGK